jgi:hypothetical protein
MSTQLVTPESASALIWNPVVVEKGWVPACAGKTRKDVIAFSRRKSATVSGGFVCRLISEHGVEPDEEFSGDGDEGDFSRF